MKLCPTCNKTFTDPSLSFCTDDGTQLLSVDAPEDEATLVRPSTGRNESGPGDQPAAPGDVPPYQPPGAFTPRDYPSRSRRRTWPWAVGILALIFLIFAGLGIAGAIFIPRMLRAANNNSANTNVNRVERNNANANPSNSNSNSAVTSENSNENSAAEINTAAPTDHDEVLQSLSDLEHEWTVANINADKKKLDRILADDYVGTTAEGKPQGKAEYLKTITRDTMIQNWEFEDLKVSLKGDRATLSGNLRLQVKNDRGQNQEAVFRFSDRFVWRDGRWQATGSEVTPVKQEGTQT